MNRPFNYHAKARELHQLRINLQMERYGYSIIRISDALTVVILAMKVAAKIAAVFNCSTHGIPSKSQ